MKEIWGDPCVLSQVNSVFPGCALPLQPSQHALHTETAPRQCWRDPPPLPLCLLPAGFLQQSLLVWLCCLCLAKSFGQWFWAGRGGSWQRILKRKYLGFYLCISFEAERSLTSLTKIWEAHTQKVLDLHLVAVRVSGTGCVMTNKRWACEEYSALLILWLLLPSGPHVV